MGDTQELIHGDATNDQIGAIDHVGSHAVLLAGPGTGKTKTLTRRVLSLVLQHNVGPEHILLLTFTRLAAGQLRAEIAKVLEPLGKALPQVSTLHSFALRQILHNSGRVEALPKPVRIADDWEERHIIEEDLKKTLNLKDIGEVRHLVNQLSTDWETLRIDAVGWEQQFPNPAFLGALQEHRSLYGETLRAELIYQLKKQMIQNRDFKLDREYRHVLIDEYQDLNACDLAVVNGLSVQSELFVAGDDDQSIYGFRFASPAGIRNFPEMFPNVRRLALEVCFRCDKSILQHAEFVAALDPQRLPKPTKPREGAADGEVSILGFRDQHHEASIIARKIKKLVEEGIKSEGITILLRSDRNGVLSSPLLEELTKNGIDASLAMESELERKDEYRIVLSLIRLVADGRDSLAWRTLLQVPRNGMGAECINSISTYARKRGMRFADALEEIAKRPSEIDRFGTRIAKFFTDTGSRLRELKAIEDTKKLLGEVIDSSIAEGELREQVRTYLLGMLKAEGEVQLDELLKTISTSSDTIEQETKKNAVNILTMHQAKGLSFDVCFIVGAEDEFIPGRNTGDREGDERRLLYVSMTRARHKLYVTFCSRRTGAQRHSGSNSGKEQRTLTRFLRDTKISVRHL